MKKDTLQKLADLWSRATEDATERQAREQELADEELKDATALPVKTTIKAGRYSPILSCNDWC
jgi:hypothetical protein